MQIVNSTFFTLENSLYIPLAIKNPTGVVAPSSESYLDQLCVSVERGILLNALGLTLYTELFALTAITIEEPENERWKRFVQGYGLWNGLDKYNSLIAYRVFERFTTETNTRLSATGTTKVNAENANNVSPKFLISNANQQFIKQYQKGYFIEPYIYNRNLNYFVDWFGENEGIELSMYEYLRDNEASFTTLEIEKFRIYETKNTFGI
jgi:hypothetical protein